MNKRQQRELELFMKHRQSVFVKTDRLFAVLLCFEWLSAMVVAMLISPRAWAGAQSYTHPHIWAAIFLGFVIVTPPIALALSRPGLSITRHVIAVSQMLYGALLIHLTGGHIETHFYIFGSLAFLAFYRDWRVLITASVVVALDHFLRGSFWPQSIYGVLSASLWRTVEHVFWVVFEDVFLIRSCLQNVTEMRKAASKQAALEEVFASVEDMVVARSVELKQSERRLATQYEVSTILAKSNSFDGCAAELLQYLSTGLMAEVGVVWSAVWDWDRSTNALRCVSSWQKSLGRGNFSQALASKQASMSLPGKVWASGKSCHVDDLSSYLCDAAALPCELGTGFAFPIILGDNVFAVVEFVSSTIHEFPKEVQDLLESLAQNIAQFIARKQSEDENHQLARIVGSSSDAIYTTSCDLKISSWNRGAERMFGYSAGQAIGSSVAMLVPEDRCVAFSCQAASVMIGASVDGFETVRTKSNGSFVDVSIGLSPIYEGSRIVGMSAIDRDVTERKIAEKRVTEFYSTVSHELRTPLTAIRGAMGLIEGLAVEPGSDEAMDLIKIARESSDRLIRLINDILDLRKIEAGKFELDLGCVSSERLMRRAVDTLVGMPEEAGVKLLLEKTIDTTVYVDFDRCTQVLTNLISNAVKFSPRGANVRVRSDLVGTGRVRFSVIDNGSGIPSSELDKLFRKFQQLDSSETRKVGGTGLGLAISKAIIVEHGGTIGVTSCPGQGSTFWFELPIHLASGLEIIDKTLSVEKMPLSSSKASVLH